MMQSVIGSTMLGIGTILVSSMFAVLKSLECVHPIIRASWRLQTTFIALAAPSALSIYLSTLSKKQIVPSMQTVWSGCGYALYNVGLCTALAKTSLLRASILSQCAPLFIVLYSINHIRKGEKKRSAPQSYIWCYPYSCWDDHVYNLHNNNNKIFRRR